MLVRDWMSKPAITIGTETSIQDAVRLLKKHDIGILPVVEDDRIETAAGSQQPTRAWFDVKKKTKGGIPCQ